MARILFLLLLFLCSAIGNTFSTNWGNCTLEIYGGRVDVIPELVNLVQFETKNISKTLGNVEQRPFFIYITSNLKDFYEKSRGPTPEWGIAVAKMNPDRIIIKAPGIANISFTRLKEVVIHELNHIYMFRLPNYQTIPSWYKEGMAMLDANEFSLLHKIEISKSIWKKEILPLSRLYNFHSYSPKKVRLAYGESAAAIEALQFFYTNNILRNIINNLRSNNNFETALELATDESMVDFQIKFEEYLESNFNWVFLLHSSKYIYAILPLILVIGFIYHKIRSNKVLSQWEEEEK